MVGLFFSHINLGEVFGIGMGFHFFFLKKGGETLKQSHTRIVGSKLIPLEFI